MTRKKSNQQKQFTYYVFLMHSLNIPPNMWLLSSSPGKHPLFSNKRFCVWTISSFIQNGVGHETVSEPRISCCTTSIDASMFICLLLACCVISSESLPLKKMKFWVWDTYYLLGTLSPIVNTRVTWLPWMTIFCKNRSKRAGTKNWWYSPYFNEN